MNEYYLYLSINIDSDEEIEISEGSVKGATFSDIADRIIEYEQYPGFISYKIPETAYSHVMGKVIGNNVYIGDKLIGSTSINKQDDIVIIDINLLPEYRNIELIVDNSEGKKVIITLLGKKLHLRPYMDAWLFYVDGKRRKVRIA